MNFLLTYSVIDWLLALQAHARGVSTSVVGLVFGTYSLAGFFSAPICGMLVSSFKASDILLIKKTTITNYIIVKSADKSSGTIITDRT